MQLYPIVLIGVLLLADGGLGPAADGFGLVGWPAAAVAWIGVLVVLGLSFGGVAWCRRRLEVSRRPGAVVAAERVVRYARWGLLAHFGVVVLVLGRLDWVRGAVGDHVLLDELLTMLPTIVGVVGTWWIYYPIERRVRDAVLMRQLDLGGAIFATPSRGRYVLTQLRLHLLFLLVPILMIVGAAELMDLAARRLSGFRWSGPAADGATLLAAVGIVLLAPLLARIVLEVEPMPEGPLRDDLERICRMHNVKVRRLLVWKTYGSMINAAVMGLIGRLRYVLLTDALLESMTHREVEAVMAHEIGHIRRHHMPWLLGSLLAAIVVIALPLFQFWFALESAAGGGAPEGWSDLAASAMVLVGAVVVLAIFRWVSRRFERRRTRLPSATSTTTGAVRPHGPK